MHAARKECDGRGVYVGTEISIWGSGRVVLIMCKQCYEDNLRAWLRLWRPRRTRSIRPDRGWCERMTTTPVHVGREGGGRYPGARCIIFGVVVVRARMATDLDPASVLRMRRDRTSNVLLPSDAVADDDDNEDGVRGSPQLHGAGGEHSVLRNSRTQISVITGRRTRVSNKSKNSHPREFLGYVIVHSLRSVYVVRARVP